MKKMVSNARTSTKQKLVIPALFAMVLFALVLFGVLPSSRDINKTHASLEALQVDLQ